VRQTSIDTKRLRKISQNPSKTKEKDARKTMRVMQRMAAVEKSWFFREDTGEKKELNLNAPRKNKVTSRTGEKFHRLSLRPKDRERGGLSTARRYKS